jgi:hypothetical protein
MKVAQYQAHHQNLEQSNGQLSDDANTVNEPLKPLTTLSASRVRRSADIAASRHMFCKSAPLYRDV